MISIAYECSRDVNFYKFKKKKKSIYVADLYYILPLLEAEAEYNIGKFKNIIIYFKYFIMIAIKIFWSILKSKPKGVV